ncbi:MAG: MATE family efflux transporter [Defluviitaleaceae bacterium]|nr:MATE family efflux transporter [Defluviitaleaceae bacterium]
MTTIRRDFAKYVSLSILGMLCFSGFVIIDTLFIAAALGPNGLASLNISISVFSILQGVGLMVGIGGATRFSIIMGPLPPSPRRSDGQNPAILLRHHVHAGDAVFTHSLALAGFFSVVFVTAGAFFASPLSRFLGANYEILGMTVDFIRTILLFAPVLMLNNVLIAFIRNDNNPRLAMAGMVTGSLSNIVLDYIFLFPLGLGMLGAALATGISVVLSIGVLSLHFLPRKSEIRRLRLCGCKIRFRQIWDTIVLGSSALVGELAFAIALITFNLVILGLEGNIGVAAFGVVANIAIVALNVFVGVAQGVQPLMSKGHGLGDAQMVRQTLKYALVLVFLLAVVVYGVVNFHAHSIVAAFNGENDPTLARLATSGLRIYFIGLIFAGVNMIIAAYFSAIDNAKTGLIISTLRSCVIIIPMLLVLSAVMGMNGVWLAFVLTELIVAALAVVLVYRRFR